MNLPEINDYEYDGYLGEGATGLVYVARGPSGPVAIKLLKRMAINPKVLSYLLKRFVAAPPNEHIIRIENFHLEGRPLYIVTDLHLQPGSEPAKACRLDAINGVADPELAWNLILQIADGLAHLHRHGIMHCSVNPRNILITNPVIPQVKITDFGQGWLHDITHMDFTGSLLFAPPEQLREPYAMFEGQAVRWDVYGFGVTAYHLLYGTFPRAQAWISQAINSRDGIQPQTCAQAVENDPDVHWPEASSEYEAQRQEILDRCLALNPKDRFIDMREVLDSFQQIDAAEKLEQERQEVRDREAQREASIVNDQKRLRFFRVAAYSLLALALLSLLFNAVSGTVIARKSREINEIEKEAVQNLEIAKASESSAHEAAEVAHLNLTQSQAMADSFLEFLLKARDPGSPEYQSLDSYIEGARQRYESLIETTTDDPKLLIENFRARLHLATIESHFESGDEIIPKFSRLIEDIRALPSETQNSPRIQQVLGSAHQQSARLYMQRGMRREALLGFQHSMELFEKLSLEEPKNLDQRRRLAKARFNHGRLLGQTSDVPGALKNLQSAMQLLEELAQSAEAREEDEYYLAMCQFETGLLRLWENQGIEAFESFQLASQGFSRLVDQKPQIPEYRFELAKCYYYLGDLAFLEKGDQDEAQLARQATLDLLTMLLEKENGNQDYQYYLALVMADMSQMERDQGQTESAMDRMQDSIAILKELRSQVPTQADYQYQLAIKTGHLGDLLLDAGRGDEAKAAMLEALQNFESVKEQPNPPGVPQHVYDFELATFLGNLADVCLASADFVMAEMYAQRAQAIWDALATSRPNDLRIRNARTLRESRPVRSVPAPEEEISDDS